MTVFGAGNSAFCKPDTAVMRCADIADASIRQLAGHYGFRARRVDDGMPIPGSYWGDTEAGLIGASIYWRRDTPAHSLLHELAHAVCMSPSRRASLDTDAGGNDAEECAVCYLEVLLADCLPPFSAGRCLADMDTWGYSFREGSACAWFSGDGREARAWLLRHELIDAAGNPLWTLRGDAG